MYEKAIQLINDSRKIVIIQPENPDGDSLGSALALDEILSNIGKEITLYCDVEMPKYLRYFIGWDRVTPDLDTSADMAIILDTSSDTLIGKAYEIAGARHFLETRPVLAIDHHHEMESSLQFSHELLMEEVVATGHVIYNLASKAGWDISPTAAENLLGAIMADSLGFSVSAVTADTLFVASDLLRKGAAVGSIESRRRELMKKPAEILEYKGKLIDRIEYYLDGKLALVHIPWEDIQAYSDKYNPSVLVLEEMRMVEGVEVAVAIKTYPDGKLTGKIRSNSPVSANIAGFFGGGGHLYAAGFRVYEGYDNILRELINAVDKSLSEVKNDQAS